MRWLDVAPLLVSVSMVACGGRIATADDGAAGGAPPGAAEPAPAAADGDSGVRRVDLATYCAAQRDVGATCQPVRSAADCSETFALASDRYRAAFVDCARRDPHYMCAYPGGPCVTREVTENPTPTSAQRALAAGYCASCEGSSAPSCVDRVFAAPFQEGDTIPFAILALSDASATNGLSCVDEAKAAPSVCEGAFVTCLAKYRPIPAN
jgi:hypothetical protein